MNWVQIAFVTVFLAIFSATAVVTILGLMQKIKMESYYLKTFSTCLLVEVAAAVILAFKSMDFSTDSSFALQKIEAVRPILSLDLQKMERRELIARIFDDYSNYVRTKKKFDDYMADAIGLSEIPGDFRGANKADTIRRLNSAAGRSDLLKKHPIARLVNLYVDLPNYGGTITTSIIDQDRASLYTEIQYALASVGEPIPTSPVDIKKTRQYVRAYQLKKGIKPPEGNVGPATLTHLISDELNKSRE